MQERNASYSIKFILVQRGGSLKIGFLYLSLGIQHRHKQKQGGNLHAWSIKQQAPTLRRHNLINCRI